MTAPHPLEEEALRRFRRLMARGQRDAAEACLQDVLVREPNLPGVHVALTRLRWPGPDYVFWLAWFHAQLAPRLYLEIGVEKGTSLALAGPSTRVVGVDPAPIGDPLQQCRADARLYRQTSAEFFAAVPAESGLEPGGFDLAFIDGDHRFETVLDDFIAAERHAAPGAVLLLHDTLPLNALTAGRERRTGFYTGDGWKIVPCLRGLRPDLCIMTVPAAPTGLTVVTGLDPSSHVLLERLPWIRETYAALPPDCAVRAPQPLLALGVNDTEWMAQWLRAARGR
ncbi:class I SAM-dependent methyltransferase [Methyloversatilis thermotolerans]|uniref:class I SAM-dependent methyltransferase n=1 Tax=Methyloversatilis thermotolerans TaxID=1346290 RepID=UPI00036FB169|nr:class I SAM-dependent methyltransferase [Methyloversatilis thermotolerans]